jgi:nucleoid DNA-binding protein
MPLFGTLTKAQIVDAVAERNGFTRKKSIDYRRNFTEAHQTVLESGCDLMMKTHAVFRLTSMTKTPSAVALSQFWDQGKFQLFHQ